MCFQHRHSGAGNTNFEIMMKAAANYKATKIEYAVCTINGCKHIYFPTLWWRI